VRSELVGPARFNEGLARHGSKALVHFEAFARLLARVWAQNAEGETTYVRADKHGGRHFYYDRLLEAFPDAWIDRGSEGPDLSRYTVRSGRRRIELSLLPRADSSDGLVALASIVSKAVREAWMDAFNAYWGKRIAGLRPTAGYPVDAARFRREIEPLCEEHGLAPERWWRAR
jgi:ribonuclease HII